MGSSASPRPRQQNCSRSPSPKMHSSMATPDPLLRIFTLRDLLHEFPEFHGLLAAELPVEEPATRTELQELAALMVEGHAYLSCRNQGLRRVAQSRPWADFERQPYTVADAVEQDLRIWRAKLHFRLMKRQCRPRPHFANPWRAGAERDAKRRARILAAAEAAERAAEARRQAAAGGGFWGADGKWYPGGKPKPGFGPDGKPLPGFGLDGKPLPGFGADGQPLPGFGPDGQPLPGFGADGKPLPGFGPDGKPLPGYGPDGKLLPLSDDEMSLDSQGNPKRKGGAGKDGNNGKGRAGADTGEAGDMDGPPGGAEDSEDEYPPGAVFRVKKHFGSWPAKSLLPVVLGIEDGGTFFRRRGHGSQGSEAGDEDDDLGMGGFRLPNGAEKSRKYRSLAVEFREAVEKAFAAIMAKDSTTRSSLPAAAAAGAEGLTALRAVAAARTGVAGVGTEVAPGDKSGSTKTPGRRLDVPASVLDCKSPLGPNSPTMSPIVRDWRPLESPLGSPSSSGLGRRPLLERVSSAPESLRARYGAKLETNPETSAVFSHSQDNWTRRMDLAARSTDILDAMTRSLPTPPSSRPGTRSHSTPGTPPSSRPGTRSTGLSPPPSRAKRLSLVEAC